MLLAVLSFITACLSISKADQLEFDPSNDIVLQELKDYKKQTYNAEFNKIGNRVLTQLNERMQQHPDSAWIYVQRGWLYISMGEQDKAIADFNKSNEIMPNTSAYMGLGMAYNNKGDVNKANESYLKAMKTKSVLPSSMQPNVIDTEGQGL
ncbi:MAG: hypothetical protein A2X47_12565 [Lentisphaerae bacterium GWF2_38_69]|nr:MAG: hypothetical protein A2X47_12565 [Lentisphaerae bacterium GWF2_38_69]